ncbi:hypothetical protein CY35_13G019000 [Sphagnum magellanicum]|nr:hypothetical protein CY35_13G019000 [Sphagnum magellanicum]
MADELGGFIPYVRGVEHAHVLLPPLETLCILEETVVREKAVESLCSIGAQMKESDMVDWFIPLVKRLGAGEWFIVRVSAYGLFHISYPGKHTLLTRMSVCVAETARLSVPRGPPRICAGNRDAAATGLVQASPLAPWVQLAPPRCFPQEGELIWLIPDTQHELLWDYSMCADTSRGTAVQELIAQSLKGALLLLLPSNRSFSFLCYFLHDHKEVTQTQERMKVRILMNSGDTSCLLFPGWILHCSGLRVT